MWWMKDAYVMPEGDPAESAGPPPEVGVLAERHVELLVEPIDRVERLSTDEEVRRHEADPLEADVGDGAIVRIVDLVGHHQPLDSDDGPILEIAAGVLQPVGEWLAVVT